MICFLLRCGMWASAARRSSAARTALIIFIRVIRLQWDLKVYCLSELNIDYINLMDQESQSKSSEEPQIEGRWTNQEHQRFITALIMHGKNWKLIEGAVQTRTTSQVRSHAQKFFLKLHKIEKERKKNLKKGITAVSKAEHDLTLALKQQSLTPDTPLEILHFLKQEPLPSAASLPEQKQEASSKQHKKTQHQILQEMLGCNEQDSFFLSLIKRNKGIFNRNEGFTELIDFPLMHEQQKADEETSNKRKKSFSLYDEEDDSAKYNQTIRRMKGQ